MYLKLARLAEKRSQKWLGTWSVIRNQRWKFYGGLKFRTFKIWWHPIWISFSRSNWARSLIRHRNHFWWIRLQQQRIREGWAGSRARDWLWWNRKSSPTNRWSAHFKYQTRSRLRLCWIKRRNVPVGAGWVGCQSNWGTCFARNANLWAIGARLLPPLPRLCSHGIPTARLAISGWPSFDSRTLW